jgi:hypothetical protein
LRGNWQILSQNLSISFNNINGETLEPEEDN